MAISKTPTTSPSTTGHTINTPNTASAKKPNSGISMKKVRTATKKYMPKSVEAAAGPTKIVKKTTSAVKAVATKEARAETKKKLTKKWNDYKKKATTKIVKSAKTRAGNVISKGLDPIIAGAITTVMNAVNEPILLETLKLLSNDSKVDPLYNNGYCIKQFLKRDFSSIIEWLIDKYGYDVISGPEAKYFNALQYGATNSSIFLLNKKAKIKGPAWYQANRYNEVKKIIKSCTMNFSSSKIMNLLEFGYSDGIVDQPIVDTTQAAQSLTKPDGTPEYANPVKYMRKILPSGYGDTGCYEFQTKFSFSKSDISSLFPEKLEPNFKQYKITYPKTSEHVTLFKSLMSESLYGANRLVSDEIHRRLYDNRIYNPFEQEALGLVNDALKATGLDKIVSLCHNRESLMYVYIKWLVEQKYI